MAPRCFMIQPFDHGKFDKRFDDVFAPAVEAAGLEPYRVDRDARVSVPIDDIEKGIREAAACFVDVTADNPNVWFELGYAIATNKDLCLVCSKERAGHFPFDIQHRKIIRFTPDAPSDFEKLKEEITERLKAILGQQDDRAAIQEITKEPTRGGLADYEAAALASIGSLAGGVDESVSNWTLGQEMAKAGFNQLACNVAVRGLRAKGLISASTQTDYQGEPFEVYAMDEGGWEWIVANVDALNLGAKSTPRGGGSFDKELDDEIPF